MSSLYLECNSGISGDMAVAALLDAGADKDVLLKVLETIPAEGFKVEISRVNKSGVDCCDFNVILDSHHQNNDHDMDYLYGHLHNGAQHDNELHNHDHHHEDNHDFHDHHHETHHHEHRNYSDVEKIIDGTKMTDSARILAKKIFMIVAQAESKAHGVPLDQVHFHEVGAVDSIVDVIALAVCFDNLNPQQVYVPKLMEGTGTVRCQHGILNIPVPAVANIAAAHSLNLSIMQEQGEFITPTGAAFAAAVKTSDVLPESFTIQKIGIGAGKRAYNRMNVVRAFVIQENSAPKDKIWKLETNIDDCTGEALGYVMELLFQSGAREVNYTPCYMKKNRPGWQLNVICMEDQIETLEKIIFLNTTTIGIRKSPMERTVLNRQIKSVQTPWGPVNVKVVDALGTTKFYPEYEDVKAICQKKNLNFQEVFACVMAEGSKLL